MSGISTTGDVKLDGDPNAFTGTNTFVNRPTASTTPPTLAGTLDFVIKRDTDLLYVTKATDQDITGKKTFKDTLTLDGASSINIGQIDCEGTFGNTFTQIASTFGNQILQGDITGAPSMALGASLIYQGGTNDVIETEGKVVCGTAPVAGEDLTNKTYVDGVAGGGGLDFFVGRSLQSSIAVSQNLRFNTMISSSNVNFADNGGGTGTTAGARFLADANTAGEWLFGFTGANIAFNGIVYFTLRRDTSGGTGSTVGYIFNNQTTGYHNVNGIWTVSVADGDTITIRPQNTYTSNITNATNTFWGIKLA